MRGAIVAGLIIVAISASVCAQLQTVMLTGPHQIPQLPDGPFENLSALELNNRGQIAFHSENDRAIGQNEFVGLWSAGSFDSFDEPQFDLDEDQVRFDLTDRGHVILRAELYVSDEEEIDGTWLWRGGNDYETIAARGSAVPGDPTKTLAWGSGIPNRIGQTIVAAGIQDSAGNVKRALLLADGATLSEVIAMEGEPIVSTGLQQSPFGPPTYQRSLYGFEYNDRGKYLIRNDAEFWLGGGEADGPREYIASRNDEVPGTSARLRYVNDTRLNNRGTVVFNGQLQPMQGVTEANDHALWVFHSGGVTELLVREGEPAHAIDGANHGFLGVAAINDHDDIAYLGEFSMSSPTSAGEAVWLDGATRQLVARTGESLSVLHEGELIGSLTSPLLNNLRQVAVEGSLVSDTTGEDVGRGIWTRNFRGSWSEVIRTGEQLEVVPDVFQTVQSVRLIGFNDLGQAAFIAGFEDDGESFAGVFLTDGVPCDFGGDAICDTSDLDQLVRGIMSNHNDIALDITGDGSVDLFDRDAWLARASVENGLSESYRLGDANLNGVVDASDLTIWQANVFSVDAAWSGGDFDADGVTDGSDFNLWNENYLTGNYQQSVPEPTNTLAIVAAFVFWLGRCVRRHAVRNLIPPRSTH